VGRHEASTNLGGRVAGSDGAVIRLGWGVGRGHDASLLGAQDEVGRQTQANLAPLVEMNTADRRLGVGVDRTKNGSGVRLAKQ